MLTHVHGNLLNASDPGRSLGVSSPTITHHLDVLDGAYMIRRLPPSFANVQKRLTKPPKIHIRDSGLLHFLAGLREPRDLDGWSRRGASFEGLVIEELITRTLSQWVRPQIHYWRTRAGGEVDLLLGAGRRLVPVDIKLSTTVERRDLAGRFFGRGGCPWGAIPHPYTRVPGASTAPTGVGRRCCTAAARRGGASWSRLGRSTPRPGVRLDKWA